MSRLSYILTFSISLFLASCSKQIAKENIIMVTIEPQRYFAEQLTGDIFKIVTMVPPGTSPETYDPSPNQMAQLAKSKAYFCIGHIGFEEVWLERIQSNNPQLPIFDNSTGIEFIASEEHHHHDHEGEHHHHHGGIDPHTWSSPKEVLIIAQNMYNALKEIDPKNEAIYQENLQKLLDEIHQTDEIVQSLVDKTSRKLFIIYHPALTYLARDYGLTQYCIETDGKEPSPEQLKNLVETARLNDIKTIFIQEEFDQRNAELIAKETGCQLVVINPLSYNWSQEIISIAKALSDE